MTIKCEVIYLKVSSTMLIYSRCCVNISFSIFPHAILCHFPSFCIVSVIFPTNENYDELSMLLAVRDDIAEIVTFFGLLAGISVLHRSNTESQRIRIRGEL